MASYSNDSWPNMSQEDQQFVLNFMDTHMALSTFSKPDINVDLVDIARVLKLLHRDSKPHVEAMWQTLMRASIEMSGFVFPPNCSQDIVETVIKAECKHEINTLYDQKVKVLRSLASDMDPKLKHNQILNMPKEELCLVVADINDLTRQRTKKSIEKCSSLLSKYGSEDLIMKSPAAQENLRKDVSHFVLLIDEWDALEKWYTAGSKECNSATQDCSSNLRRFHAVSRQVIGLANSCSKTISQAEKQKIKTRIDGNEKVGMYDRIRSWF
jgi:hypothetical protein